MRVKVIAYRTHAWCCRGKRSTASPGPSSIWLVVTRQPFRCRKRPALVANGGKIRQISSAADRLKPCSGQQRRCRFVVVHRIDFSAQQMLRGLDVTLVAGHDKTHQHRSYKMATEFTAFARTAQGSSASRRLRNTAKVPGIVYGGEAKPELIELDHNALWHALKKEDFHSSILTMTLGSATSQVLLRDVQYHPFKQLIQHIDFQRVDANKKLHMKVPVHFVNQEVSPAVKLSAAIVNHVLNEVEVACLPKDLPRFIEWT